MTELEIRHDGLPAVYAEDPTGGRLVAWAKAASAAHQLAKALVTTTFVPAHFKGNDGDATAAIMAGDEVGMAPLASLRAFYVVHGTPALYARAMVALVQRHHHSIWTEKSTPTEVVVCGRRRGFDRTERAVWSIARAQKAGYTSNKKYQSNPEEMLWAKAASEICKKIASDVLAGMPASVEDLELDDQPTTTITRAEPTTPKRVQRTLKTVELPPDVEPTFDEPEAAPPPAAAVDTDDVPLPFDPITKAQLTKLHVLFKERALDDRDDALAWCSGILGRELESTKTLAKWEASDLIDALEGKSR